MLHVHCGICYTQASSEATFPHFAEHICRILEFFFCCNALLGPGKYYSWRYNFYHRCKTVLLMSVMRQVDDLGVSALSPFQRLGESISSSLNGGLDSLKTGAQGAVEGAQTQLSQSVTENIGNPFQASALCALIPPLTKPRCNLPTTSYTTRTPHITPTTTKIHCTPPRIGKSCYYLRGYAAVYHPLFVFAGGPLA